MGCNHGDIDHWFPKFGKSMETARNDVAALLSGTNFVTSTTTGTTSTVTTVNYQVQVTASDGLNCRTSSSTAGSIVKTYPKGTILTITKEQNNWGYTGDGWVSLYYTQKYTAPTVNTPQVENNTNSKEDDTVTQEQFDQMMSNYLTSLAKQPPSDWSLSDRMFCEQNGLIKGDSEGNKMYKKFVTREEIASLMSRLYELVK